MRRFHRWISTVCMIFLAWVSITGTLLALDEANPPAGMGGTPPPPAAAPQASVPPSGLPLRLRLHNLLKELHTGSIIGLSGRTVDVLTGTSFVVLSVTGTIMYFQLLGARRRIGRTALFWSK